QQAGGEGAMALQRLAKGCIWVVISAGHGPLDSAEGPWPEGKMARSFNLDGRIPQQLAQILGGWRHFCHEGFWRAGARGHTFIG
ncbi:MAG: hypothetical protein RLZZ57_909, partial [Pseudomonadota bacterium]